MLELSTAGGLSSLANPSRQFSGALDPDSLAPPLKRRGVGRVRQNFLQFGPRKVRLLFGEIKFGQLHSRPGIRVVFRDTLPDSDGGIRFTERSKRLGQS